MLATQSEKGIRTHSIYSNAILARVNINRRANGGQASSLKGIYEGLSAGYKEKEEKNDFKCPLVP